MNTNGITLYNGTNSYSINGGYGTYLGSVYMTGNGQTTVNMKPSAAAGGSANVIGIWNAYNRVTIYSLNRDSNTSWTDTSAAWEMADTSDLNRVTWVDGLQQTSVRAYYAVQTSTDTNVSAPSIGVDLNSTSATPNIISAMLFGTASDWNTRLSVEESFPPQLGANYVQAMQNTSGKMCIRDRLHTYTEIVKKIWV